MNTKYLNLATALALAFLTLGYVNPASAGNCTKIPPPPSCEDGQAPGGGGGQDGGGKFSAVITGTVSGSSGGDQWNGGPKGVGGNTTGGVIGTTTLDLDGLGLDSICFNTTPYYPTQVAVREGKRGTAEAWFWFPALALDEDGIPTLARYLFQMFGTFPEGTTWPPEGDTEQMDLYSWEMKLENGQTSLKDGACTDESAVEDGFLTTIFITRE